MNTQEAETLLGQYAAFAPFLTEEARARPSWRVKEIAEALRAGPRPSGSDVWVRAEINAGHLKAVDFGGNVGWVAYREDLLTWLVETMLPQHGGATGTHGK